MRTTLVLLALLTAVTVPAQAGEWEKSADLSLNLNQSSYNNAWAGGESGSIAWSFLCDVAAAKALSPHFNWRHTLKLSYGQTHTQEKDEADDRYWTSPVTSTDRIFYESLLRMTLGRFVEPYASVTFDSRFYDSSVPQVKRYINPMLFSEAVGVSRTFAKSEKVEFISRLGLSIRQHVSKDVISIDPEETETNTATDSGMEWVTEYAQTFGQGSLKYATKLRVFQAFYYSKSDELKGQENEEYWKTADVAWEHTVSASVTKYVQVSLFCELLYDKEIDLRGRFKETLGLGLTYKLF